MPEFCREIYEIQSEECPANVVIEEIQTPKAMTYWNLALNAASQTLHPRNVLGAGETVSSHVLKWGSRGGQDPTH